MDFQAKFASARLVDDIMIISQKRAVPIGLKPERIPGELKRHHGAIAFCTALVVQASSDLCPSGV